MRARGESVEKEHRGKAGERRERRDARTRRVRRAWQWRESKIERRESIDC